MIKAVLKKGREESLYRFHPWVFSGAIAQVHGTPEEGDVVAVHAADGRFLACGHWQIGSIAVRILSFASLRVLRLTGLPLPIAIGLYTVREIIFLAL